MEMLLIYLVCFASQQPVHHRYSHVRLPVHGTIHKKTLYGFFGKKDDDSGLYAIPMNNPLHDGSKIYWPYTHMGGSGVNFRHHIQYSSIWISHQPGFLFRMKFADLELYNIKNREAFFEKYPGLTPPHLITLRTAYDKYETIARKQFGLGLRPLNVTDVLGFGSVPTSDNSCKSYILPKESRHFEIWDSHFRWDEKTKGWETKPAARFEKIGEWVADLDSDTFQKRAKAIEELEKLGDLAKPALKKLLASKPGLETRRRAEILLEKLTSRESKAEGLCEDADNYEKFPCLFAEDFYFFLRKNDYYFVTESGGLYYAPSPQKEEKSRTMKALWDDPKRPIVAIIEDADRGAVWLFAKDNNPGAKLDLCIQMDKSVTTHTIDPAKLAKVDIDNPRARQLLEYIPLIRPDLANNAKKGP